jgi:ABC-type branched-subunit amino acid transport system substrate-binding protein
VSVKPYRKASQFIFVGMCIVLMGMVVGCGATRSYAITRIALLAPFEGRYREVGYNAYYAALLALGESGSTQIELLAVDDGGSPATAAQRAAALARDPWV